MPKNWIGSAIKKPGALRQSLGVKGDANIPPGNWPRPQTRRQVGQRARLAQTLKKLHK